MDERQPNIFVDRAVRELGLKRPDLPAVLTEHYAQCGEDIIVAALLEARFQSKNVPIGEATYCEVGANHPIATSATYLLHRRYGCAGVLVEANPRLIDDLKKGRPADVVLNIAITPNQVESIILSVAAASELSSLDPGFVEHWPAAGGGIVERVEVPAITLEALFESYLAGAAPDYLSIDIEGLDLQVLSTLDFSKYRPYVIQCEPSDHYLPGNGLAMIEFMSRRGYLFVARTAVNLIFIDQTLRAF